MKSRSICRALVAGGLLWLFTLGVGACAPVPSADLQQRLEELFVNRVPVLRHFYTGDDLVFDAGGNLVGEGHPGFGPVDGALHIRKLKLTRQRLLIEGDRPIVFQSSSDGALVWGESPWKRTLRIDASAIEDEASALRILFSIFHRPKEHLTQPCSQEEYGRFRNLAAHYGARLTISAKGDQRPAVQAVEEIPRVCFPTGEAGYAACCGIDAPRELHMPDPGYPVLAQRRRLSGRVTVLMIVDTTGHPTAVTLVSKPLGAGMEIAVLEAIRKWRFRPATFQGVAVPVAITAEIGFAASSRAQAPSRRLDFAVLP